ncbi:hypothetical protein MBLNU13_g06832t2 [Cladosporium sp. NU13]
MFSMHTTLMDSDEAYQALLGLILADEPSSHDGMTWDRIALSFTVASPNQRHINYLIEAASNQLLGQLTDTLCRMFMLNPNDMATLANGAFQAYAAAIAALPQRVVDLRALRGAEFCEVLRRMVEERWVVRDAVASWSGVAARREAELESERRALLERIGFSDDEWARKT